MAEPLIRNTDTQARVTLPQGFADHLVVIEQIDDTELRIRKAPAIPEGEAWLWRNASATGAVLLGIEQAKAGQLVPGPDLDADAERFASDEVDPAGGD